MRDNFLRARYHRLIAAALLLWAAGPLLPSPVPAATITHSSQADFSSGTFSGLGTAAGAAADLRLDYRASGINPSAATGAIPEGRIWAAAAAWNGRLYLSGGTNGGAKTSVYSAAPAADGSIAGWNTEANSLPSARYQHAMAAWNGRLYAAGGRDQSDLASASVYSAPINSDGSVGAWSAEANSLPAARYAPAMTAWGGRLYITGGNNSVAKDTVYSAALKADGSVGEWASGPGVLPSARYGHSMAAYNGRLYIAGGYDAAVNRSSAVFSAPLEEAGAGAWTQEPGSLVFDQAYMGMAAWNGRLYILGGDSSVGMLNTVYSASVTAAGTLGTWSGGSALPGKRGYTAAAAWNGYIYVMGGYDEFFAFQTPVFSVPVRTEELVRENWAAEGNSLPLAVSGHAMAAVNGRLYVSGGFMSGTGTDTVHSAPVNGDGSLGAWRQESTRMPEIRYNHVMAAWNGRLYAAGSYTMNSVVSAPVNGDGTVGTWATEANALPAGLENAAMAAVNGVLYLAGGFSGGPASAVYSSTIAPDGSVGAWTTEANSLPAALYGHAMQPYNGRLYVTGGVQTGVSSMTFSAPINPDGSVGAWTSEIFKLPMALKNLAMAAEGGRLCVAGGKDSGGVEKSVVYVSTINGAGAIGPWTAYPSLPAGRSSHSMAAWNGRLYITGGYLGISQSSVYSSSLTEWRLYSGTGTYFSPLLDLGGPKVLSSVSWTQTAAPAGSSVSVWLATASAAGQALSTFTFISNGAALNYSARYAQYRVDMSPGGSAGSPPADLTPAIDDVVITYTEPGPGAQFLSQSVSSYMATGAYYNVSVTMRNTGQLTWTKAAQYRLGSWNPPDNQRWGLGRVDLDDADSVEPGQEKTFAFTATAPQDPGAHDFQWRMLQEGVQWFGDQSQNFSVAVASNAAEFVSMSVSSSMISGSSYTVSVIFRNTGTSTWTRAGLYRLGSRAPADNTVWLRTTNRVELAPEDSVQPGQNATFYFTVAGSSFPGTVDFQWRMLQEGTQWFPQAAAETPSAAIQVSPSLSLDRKNYAPGEAPVYTISGAQPGSEILWSGWKNGIQAEAGLNLGQTTDSAGAWTGGGPPFAGGDAGFWERRALIAGSTAAAYFNVAASLTAAAPSLSSHTLGASHVAGDYRLTAEPFLLEGAKLAANLNPNVIFAYLTPRFSSRDYPATDFGAGPVASLTGLAQSAPYQELFSLPFSTYVLTAYTFANHAWTEANPRGVFTPGQAAAETAEIRGLAEYLLQTYQGTGKTFILKNWEGDWAMNQTFDPYQVPDSTQIAAMTDWLNARHAGVEQARAALPGLAGVRVADAIEFNMADRARRDLPCLLNQVAPNAGADYLSYSSWETVNAPATGDLRRRILDDIAFIRGHPGAQGRDLIISEYGFKETLFADSGERTGIAGLAFLDAAIPLAFYWGILDNECQQDQPAAPGVCQGYGLLRQDGSRAPAWTALRSLLDARNEASFISLSAPLSLRPGETREFQVTLRNDGNRAWDAANGYKLASANPADNTSWGLSRVTLAPSSVVLPGEQKIWTFNASAPASTGTYNFQWNMVQEGVGVFGTASANAVILVTGTAPPAGQLSGSAPGTSSITWSWADADGEDGYRVLASTGGYVSPALPAGTVSWTEQGLSTNSAFTRLVETFNAAGASTSAPLTRYTLAAEPSSLVFTEVFSSSAALSWSANTNPPWTEYGVSFWEAGGSTSTLTTSSTSVSFTGLAPGSTYYSAVRALNGAGVQGPPLYASTVTSAAASATALFTPGGGGAVSFSGAAGEIRLEIPPGAFAAPVNITIREPSSLPEGRAAALDLSPSGVGAEIVPDAAVQPGAASSLLISYRDADVAGLDESRLVVARYDEASGSWLRLPSSPDPAANRVTARLNHFSIYQLMAYLPAQASSQARAYPNPCRLSAGCGEITISRAAPGALMRIFTLSGELVKVLRADSLGTAAWDLRNKDGARAAGGVYFLLIKGGGGKTIKIAVIR